MNEIRRIGLCWFMKVPVGNLGLYTNGHFSAKNIRFKFRKSGIIHKVPVGNLGLYTNRDFSAKNIRFKIRKSGIIHKVPVGNIGLYTNRDFSAKNIRFKIRKKEFVYFSKSPGLEGPKTSERTLFSQKYFV
jgi:hypothetical protein